MIKIFEQFNEIDPFGEEDWEGHDGDINNLRFGVSGPEFECGDRVIFTSKIDQCLFDEIGTVVDYNDGIEMYIVCFDNVVSNNRGQIFIDRYNAPYGHCYWVYPSMIRKIE